jgi:hypothetical protein
MGATALPSRRTYCNAYWRHGYPEEYDPTRARFIAPSPTLGTNLTPSPTLPLGKMARSLAGVMLLATRLTANMVGSVTNCDERDRRAR